MRVITANVNGIRAAARKGFFEWLATMDADCICLQETKAQMAQLKDPLFYPSAYEAYFSDAEKKGYSGVGLYLKKTPLKIESTLGWDCADTEGRYLAAEYENLIVISVYLPSGSSSPDRQIVKMDFLDKFYHHLLKWRSSGKEIIICGDWNIAHTRKDLKNWRGNQKSSGFLPEERAWMDTVFNDLAYVDAFRVLNQEADQYTWWSMRQRAWEKNVGWRIDYHIVSPGLKDKITAVSIYRGQQFSDHAPVIIDYDFSCL